MHMLITFRLPISLGFAALILALACAALRSAAPAMGAVAMIVGVAAAAAFFYRTQLEVARQELEQKKP